MREFRYPQRRLFNLAITYADADCNAIANRDAASQPNTNSESDTHAISYADANAYSSCGGTQLQPSGWLLPRHQYGDKAGHHFRGDRRLIHPLHHGWNHSDHDEGHAALAA